jgi:predicted DNA-binding transcriptional regulator AlpA
MSTTESSSRKKPPAQVAAEKAAKLKAARATPSTLSKALITANAQAQHAAGLTADTATNPHDRIHVHGPRGPPVRLLGRHDVCEIVGVTYATIWQMMRDGKFPRSRIVGGKSMWLSSEIDAWIAGLPIRRLKGDSDETVQP